MVTTVCASLEESWETAAVPQQKFDDLDDDDDGGLLMGDDWEDWDEDAEDEVMMSTPSGFLLLFLRSVSRAPSKSTGENQVPEVQRIYILHSHPLGPLECSVLSTRP